MDLSVIVECGEDGPSPRTTEELTCIPEALQLLLGPYRSLLPDPRLYGEDRHGLLRYFEEVVGPYAKLIDKGFPTRAMVKHQMRPESVEFLTPHVGELLRFLVGSVSSYTAQLLIQSSSGTCVCDCAGNCVELWPSHVVPDGGHTDPQSYAEIRRHLG